MFATRDSEPEQTSLRIYHNQTMAKSQPGRKLLGGGQCKVRPWGQTSEVTGEEVIRLDRPEHLAMAGVVREVVEEVYGTLVLTPARAGSNQPTLSLP